MESLRDPFLQPSGDGGFTPRSPGPVPPSPIPPTTSFHRERAIWDVTDSINYHAPNNAVALARAAVTRRRRRTVLFGITGRTAAALATTLTAGLIIGITARAMESAVDAAVAGRNVLIQTALERSLATAAGTHVALATVLALATAGVVQLVAPGAAGSGVSLCIALLNGNNIAGLLTPAVYVVKLMGTVAARAAGLALGPEAPMVHLGACAASLFFALERRMWLAWGRGRTEVMNSAFSNASHREMVSAGAAAGIAAAFGAPVGGVLFALEEACSVWSRKTAWRCLICTATAVFTMSQLMPSTAGGGILSLSGIYPLSSRQWLKQLPFVALVSAGAGLLGALFNLLRGKMQSLRAARRRHALRLAEAAAAAAATAAAIAAAASALGTCLPLPMTWKEDDVMRWTCPAGQYNDLATALLGSSPFVVRALLGLGSESEPINNICTLGMPCYFAAPTLAALAALYLLLMVVASGLAIPGGLFMPSVIVGGSFGALAGMLLTAVLPPSWDVQPGVYAMVGATAALAAVFRSAISLVVIVVEGTRGIEFLPGILAATIVSNFIAHWLHPEGVYESELERDGRVFFLRQEPPGALRWRTAGEVMATPVQGLRRVEEVARVVELLTTTLHNGFPVWSPAYSLGGAADRVEGFILRTQLLILLQERAFCDAAGRYLAPLPDVAAYEAALDAVMQQAELSCDGLGGAAEMALAVDPLGRTDSIADKEEAVTAALGPTLETLETLRGLPSLVGVVEDAAAAAVAIIDAELAATEPRPLSPPPMPSLERSSPLDLAGTSPRHAADVLYINLGPWMDRGMLTVRPDTPATAVHKLFVAMSLRHVCVVDVKGAAVGIVTRKDLDNAAGAGPWRQAKLAPEPERAWGDGDGGGLQRERSWLSSSVHALMARLGGSPASSVLGGGGDSAHPSASASLERQPRVLGAPTEDEEAPGGRPRGQRWPAMNRYESML